MLSYDKLQFLRIIHNVTQADMAECLGVSTRYVGMVEHGDETMSEETYKKWLNVCYGKIKVDGRRNNGRKKAKVEES